MILVSLLGVVVDGFLDVGLDELHVGQDLVGGGGPGDRLVVATLLRTEQDAADGRDGQTCSDWWLDYTMRLISGIWRIDKAKLPGARPTAC